MLGHVTLQWVAKKDPKSCCSATHEQLVYHVCCKGVEKELNADIMHIFVNIEEKVHIELPWDFRYEHRFFTSAKKSRKYYLMQIILRNHCYFPAQNFCDKSVFQRHEKTRMCRKLKSTYFSGLSKINLVR